MLGIYFSPDRNMSYLDCPTAIRDRLAQYRQAPRLWLDTEVADCFTPRPRLSLIQVATVPEAENAVVLDVLDQPELVEEFIESIMADRAIEKVFHNASFDLRFLGKERAQNVTCTLKLARSLPKELLPVENHKLKTLTEYIVPAADVDKSEQASDWGRRPLRASQLHYAKMDVVYLGLVHQGLLAVQSLVSLSKAQPGDIDKISSRYRALEETLKPLLAERDRLKEQLQTLMTAQSLTETGDYQLKIQPRQTKKCSLRQLAGVVANGDWDVQITLSKEIQQQLGEAMEQLDIQTEVTNSHTLRPRF
jgi:ribonuclease D